MRVLFLIFSSILIGRSYGGLILHNIRDHLHSKLYGHGLHGEIATFQNSPIINVNNYQDVSQQALAQSIHNQNQQMYGHQPSGIGHIRGDQGTLSNYGQHLYGGDGFMNSNIKAGGMKYGGAYGGHDSMKQESYYHREGPKFGQHHDTNMFGNTKIVSPATTSSSASSSSSSSSAGSSSAASSSSASSSSSVIGGGNSHFNTRVKPWLY